jgi:hypothetical protein
MKKGFMLAAFSLSALFVEAQNVQLHNDMGSALYAKELSGRPVLTSTVEMFRSDKWGSSFFFIDMDYAARGVVGANWTISRELRFWESPLSVQLSYDGGLTSSFPFQNAYLGGVTYTYNDALFNKGFSLSALYRHIQQNDSPHNAQLTGVWYINFAKDGLLSFSGFGKLWSEKTSVGTFIFLGEPQFWVNLNKLKGVDEFLNLSVGSELELSYDFAERDGWYFVPTLAIKWTFN